MNLNAVYIRMPVRLLFLRGTFLTRAPPNAAPGFLSSTLDLLQVSPLQASISLGREPRAPGWTVVGHDWPHSRLKVYTRTFCYIMSVYEAAGSSVHSLEMRWASLRAL